MNLVRKLTQNVVKPGLSRNFSLSSQNNASYTCKLLVVGGGTAGCTIAAKFTRRLKKDSVIVLEPADDHYYQPLFTLIGAGVKKYKEDIVRPTVLVLPDNARWIQDTAHRIDPANNQVTTCEGHVINYEYIVIAVGLDNDTDAIPGLGRALEDPTSGVSTIFSPVYCENTWRDLQTLKDGEAIFTYPNSLIKCPGAPQKIAYLTDSYLTKVGVRSKVKIIYNTCLPVIFGVKKYAETLDEVVRRKDIKVNYKTVLKEVCPEQKTAIFYHKECEDKLIAMPYKLLHVTPPMKTPDCIFNSEEMSDEKGFLKVDKYTLQHDTFKNMYGIGDCTNTPNSKTAAAIAKQAFVLEQNLLSTMKSDNPKEKYDGYGACPLVTSYNTCILAEFLYDGVIHETLPLDQGKERYFAYYMKRDFFPFLYWNFMLKGYYNGPEFVRKIVNPFAK